MSHPGGTPIDVAELERAVREADPAVWVVPPRILRRVIKRDRGLTRLGLHVPHRDVYPIAGESLRAIVEGIELGLRPGEDWPAIVILVARPAPEDLAKLPGHVVLTDYWQILFQARVHVAVAAKLDSGGISVADLEERVAALGGAALDEVRAVLRQEGALLSPADARTVYVEFAATYLALRHFAPGRLPHTFPGIDDIAGVEAMLARDVDAEALFAATRLEGATDPRLALESSLDLEDEEEAEEVVTEEAEAPARGAARRLIHRAMTAGARGNLVRAAILRTQAARRAPPALADSIRAGARSELDRLVARLAQALDAGETEADRWKKALPTLLERSARGFWTAEARLLYDLQKVCVDHEREVFKIDLLDWLASWGRRPLQRPQPLLREVMMANHLRSASRRLRQARLASDDRARLAALLRPAVARAEAALRDRLRGPIDATLSRTGIVPHNLPERVAYRKLIEELLDRIAGRGFLSLGDLRDACSRSNLKLPDLSGPREFLRGDRLLQADAALARALDGVYRRGEVYLRGLQRFSSLAFATPWGRFLTLFVALPFGGSFIVLEGLQHLAEPLMHWLRGGQVHVHFRNWASLLLLGTVALGVINSVGFRRHFIRSLHAIGRALRLVLVDLLGRPLFQLLFVGKVARFAWRYVFKPALVAFPVWALARWLGLGDRASALVGGVCFLEAVLVVNSRIGRDLQEIFADEAARAWRQLYRDLVPGLFRLVMATFNTILETVERLLYAVDEWLRFRAGQTRASLAIKILLGGVWFLVAYLVRIYVNLLIEPQVNPIKHFPVVTVSHKIIIGFSITLTKILAAPLLPFLGKVVANFIAGTTVLLIPGVFGFLVWEFKENWRLYEANRRALLGSVVVGDHGETIGRLLRPGFHSGTLPKLFAKLRRSERRWLREGREKGVLKHREQLHHVKDALRHFVDREFLALVRASKTLGPLAIEAGAIAVSTNRIRFELRRGDDGDRGKEAGLWIALEERSGRLIASVTRAGWLHSLSDARRRALITAVAGFYKMSGVEWIREPGGDGGPPPWETSNGRPSGLVPVSFQGFALRWPDWVDAWEQDQSGVGHPRRFITGFRLFPSPPRGRQKRRKTSKR